jgi:inosine-uridine nucleoside N-ribohydrolase
VGAGDPEEGQEYGGAIDFMLDQLDRAKTPITLIGTGPWTNIAEVLRLADRKQKSMIECVALMGGEIRLLHSCPNITSDPEGADFELKSGVSLFAGTWSVTRQLYFTMAQVAKLTR